VEDLISLGSGKKQPIPPPGKVFVVNLCFCPLEPYCWYKLLRNLPKIDQNHIFRDETGCILNEKMMPDVTIMVPELEVGKQISKTNISMDKCGGTRNFQTLRPPTL
jgi:hypothetical protein